MQTANIFENGNPHNIRTPGRGELGRAKLYDVKHYLENVTQGQPASLADIYNYLEPKWGHGDYGEHWKANFRNTLQDHGYVNHTRLSKYGVHTPSASRRNQKSKKGLPIHFAQVRKKGNGQPALWKIIKTEVELHNIIKTVH